MAVTTQELYDYLLANFPKLQGRKRVSAYPAISEAIKDVLYYNQTEGTFQYFDGVKFLSIGGAASGVVEQRLVVPIASNLDTNFGPVTMEGIIENIRIVPPVEITAMAFRAKLNSSTTYTELADKAALQTWISANVLDKDSIWQLWFVPTTVGEFVQVTFQFVYQIPQAA